MPGGAETTHVRPGLGDDDLGGAPAHSGNGDQPLQYATERADHPVDLAVEPVDADRELVDVFQVHPQHQRVMGAEPALQGLPQLRDLGPHPSAGQLSQRGHVPHPGDQRLQHLPGRDPEDVRHDRVQLDPGVFE